MYLYQFETNTGKRSNVMSDCAYHAMQNTLGKKAAKFALIPPPHQGPYIPSVVRPGWNVSILKGVGLNYQIGIK